MSRAVVDAKEFSHAMSKISKILKKCGCSFKKVAADICCRWCSSRQHS